MKDWRKWEIYQEHALESKIEKKIVFENEEQASTFVKEIFPLLVIKSMSFRSDELVLSKTVNNLLKNGYIKISNLEKAKEVYYASFRNKESVQISKADYYVDELEIRNKELEKELIKNKEPIEKTCASCTHINLGSYEEPCSSCCSSILLNWEKKV